MRNRTGAIAGILIALTVVLLFASTYSLAADFSLSWDPNCNSDPTLIGYNIYYRAGASVLADPDQADIIFIDLADPNFDPDHPNYIVANLSDDARYYFAISAMYDDGESDMSNEISGTNGAIASTPATNSNLNANSTASGGGSSSGGCFISAMR